MDGDTPHLTLPRWLSARCCSSHGVDAIVDGQLCKEVAEGQAEWTTSGWLHPDLGSTPS